MRDFYLCMDVMCSAICTYNIFVLNWLHTYINEWNDILCVCTLHTFKSENDFFLNCNTAAIQTLSDDSSVMYTGKHFQRIKSNFYKKRAIVTNIKMNVSCFLFFLSVTQVINMYNYKCILMGVQNSF